MRQFFIIALALAVFGTAGGLVLARVADARTPLEAGVLHSRAPAKHAPAATAAAENARSAQAQEAS